MLGIKKTECILCAVPAGPCITLASERCLARVNQPFFPRPPKPLTPLAAKCLVENNILKKIKIFLVTCSSQMLVSLIVQLFVR